MGIMTCNVGWRWLLRCWLCPPFRADIKEFASLGRPKNMRVAQFSIALLALGGSLSLGAMLDDPRMGLDLLQGDPLLRVEDKKLVRISRLSCLPRARFLLERERGREEKNLPS